MARKRFPSASRRGAALAIVLISLFIAGLLALALIQLILTHHRQRAVRAQQQQCFWLAESGVQRAIQRLGKSAEYSGETWTVSADLLGAARPGVVTIQVTKAASSPQERSIRVEARYPDDPVRRVVFQREHLVKLPIPGVSS